MTVPQGHRSFRDIASPFLRGLVPYVPGKPIEEVERELGITDSVKIASNENPLGPSPKALQAIRAALPDLHRYPDGEGFYLKQALAEHLQVSSVHLILGNGSNEILELLARCFLSPADEVVLAEPAFVVYGMVTQLMGSRKIAVPLTDYTHDLPAMAAAITPRTKMVFIGNPNNPTGTAVSPKVLASFVASVPEGVIVVCDEAYVEYMPPEMVPDTVQWIREGCWVVTLRTFSKIYGLAGIRLGYGIGPSDLIELLNRARQPFNTNLLAQRAACAALTDTEHLDRSRAVNEEGKKYLTEQLRRLGLTGVPTVANFLLVETGGDGAALTQALLRRGVIVRPMGIYHLPRHIRVTIGTPEENRRFIAALSEVMATDTA